MNDPTLSAERFQDLVELAAQASTPYERAAVYAAAQALSAQFVADFHEREAADRGGDGYAMEKVEQTRWGICAAMGYDIHNGLDEADHLSNARAAVSILKQRVAAWT